MMCRYLIALELRHRAEGGPAPIDMHRQTLETACPRAVSTRRIALVFRHGGIYLVRPRIDPALEIIDVTKTALLQQLYRLSAPRATMAMDNDRKFVLQLICPLGDFSQRD